MPRRDPTAKAAFDHLLKEERLGNIARLRGESPAVPPGYVAKLVDARRMIEGADVERGARV
jgi:hypothetical protein